MGRASHGTASVTTSAAGLGDGHEPRRHTILRHAGLYSASVHEIKRPRRITFAGSSPGSARAQAAPAAASHRASGAS
jgi:hypothetical protein